MNRSWYDFLAAHGAGFDRGGVASFGAPATELAAASDAAVVCDLSPFAVLRVAGLDAATFLQGQFTNDVAALGLGSAQYSAWCSPKGRMLANFVVRRSGDSIYELLLPESLSDTIAKRLRMFVLRSRVTVFDASSETIRLGVGGPGAGAAIGKALGVAPAVGDVASAGELIVTALPGPRYIIAVAPEAAASCWDRLRSGCRARGLPGMAMVDDTRGYSGHHPTDIRPVRAAGRQLGCAGRDQLSERLLRRPGNRRPNAIPRAP